MSIATISKAIAGFVAGIVVAYLAKYGMDIDAPSLELVLYGLVSGALVWLAPKNKV